LNGPTDNFRKTDDDIISQVNFANKYYFEQPAEMNHVLAQIYENSTLINERNIEKQKKAKIKEHSDKTKDMPRNGLIAFCSFYKGFVNDNLEGFKKSNDDPYDYCYNETSVLTFLHFRLKKTVDDSSLQKEFSVKLYPNSVFIIPLSTNRLYTHEIVPSTLPVNKIPTRMGYVIRCSNTEAVHKDFETYINENGTYIKLQEINNEELNELRNLYYEENMTHNVIDYKNIYFSMNSGDYLQPNI
jgi:hypothetical protein